MFPTKYVFGVFLIGQITFIGATVTERPPSLSTVIQATLTNTVIDSTSSPIDIENITSIMTTGFKDVKLLTSKLLDLAAQPTWNAENLLNLLSVVHDTFDVIIATARGLDHKLKGVVGVVDLAMVNIQVALQTFIQTVVVNVIITGDIRDNTQNDINYSLLGVVDGIQLLLDTSYRLLNGIVTRSGNDLAKAMMCLEGIVQTILSIIENVLHSLRMFLMNFKIRSTDAAYIMPKFDVALTNSLNKLASNLTHPVTSVIKESLEPALQAIIFKLKDNLDSVTGSTLDSIKNISQPISDLVATIVDSQKIAIRTLTTIPHIVRTMPPSLLSLSNEIKSLHGNTIGVQSTFNVALSNTVASFHSLTSYLTLITSLGFTSKVGMANKSKLVTNTEIVLLLLATNIQTLIDTSTQAIGQSLIQSVNSKGVAQRGDLLKESTTKISLLLENVVKIHLRAMQTLLNGVSQALRTVLNEYSESLVSVAVTIKHSLGDLGNVMEDVLTGSMGNVSGNSAGRLRDAVRAFKMVLDNLDSLRINVRNTLRAIESFPSK
ncbi:uncharacterized protein LOC119074377 [Bradysia coprophila]|uniref:uncharacterized protein LOC119074377 n=1 Tax=Bradysia coprophila TaxID=38358 RepID=UPI00187DB44B|nr:uncharacterized protein LOC119074377 [Bradysia coprophila]